MSRGAKPGRLQSQQVCGVPCVCLADQSLVEPSLSDTRFVSGDQQYRFAVRIESEGYPPLAAVGRKSQFLHVCVPGPLEGVDPGAPKLRADRRDQLCLSKQFNSDGAAEVGELPHELRREAHFPSHLEMSLNAYAS